MLHEKSEEILQDLYKTASFVVQAIVFRQTGKYIKHKEELLAAAAPRERAVVENFMNLKNGGAVDFAQMSETLFEWARMWISEVEV